MLIFFIIKNLLNKEGIGYYKKEEMWCCLVFIWSTVVYQGFEPPFILLKVKKT